MSQATGTETQASYKTLLMRRKFFWENRRRVLDARLREEMRILGQTNRKVDGYRWVRDLDIPTVGFALYPGVEEALSDTRRDRFVLKPAGGHSSQGVYLLTRDGTGGFDCAMTNRHYADGAAVAADFAHKRAAQRMKMTAEIIVEDLVEDALGFDVPLDYKIYAFATDVPLVMQRYAPVHLKKENWLFEFYDGQGRVLGPVRLKTAGNAGQRLTPPDRLDEALEMARRMISAAGVSFVRIDMYVTPQGPLFGEFTPVPNNGLEAFVPEIDRMLGRSWAAGLAECGLDYFARLDQSRTETS